MIALTAIWKFLKGIPWQLWLVLALIAAIWWHGSAMYAKGYDTANGEWQARHDKLTIAAERKAREREQSQAQEMARIAAELETQRKAGYEARDKVISDLRAGNIRLRQHWQGCPRLPEVGGTPSGGDADAGLREAGAGDLVRLGAEADAIIRACQAVILSDRKEQP